MDVLVRRLLFVRCRANLFLHFTDWCYFWSANFSVFTNRAATMRPYSTRQSSDGRVLMAEFWCQSSDVRVLMSEFWCQSSDGQLNILRCYIFGFQCLYKQGRYTCPCSYKSLAESWGPLSVFYKQGRNYVHTLQDSDINYPTAPKETFHFYFENI